MYENTSSKKIPKHSKPNFFNFKMPVKKNFLVCVVDKIFWYV